MHGNQISQTQPNDTLFHSNNWWRILDQKLIYFCACAIGVRKSIPKIFHTQVNIAILLTSEQSNFRETFTCWIWCFTWNNNNNNKGKKTNVKCSYWSKQIETKLFLFRQLLTSIASNSTVNIQRWLNIDVIWLACSHWLPTITVDVIVDAKSCRKQLTISTYSVNDYVTICKQLKYITWRRWRFRILNGSWFW